MAIFRHKKETIDALIQFAYILMYKVYIAGQLL